MSATMAATMAAMRRVMRREPAHTTVTVTRAVSLTSSALKQVRVNSRVCAGETRASPLAWS